MRGEAERQVPLLTLTTPERRVPQDHPIRRIKALADAELARLSPVFETMYSERGRPSIPPEVLLKSCLLIALYSVRSERQFCERLQYDLLFRFFLDLDLDEDAFDASSFAKNKAAAAGGRRRPPVLRGGRAAGEGRRGCCRPSTSPWMARCSRPGRRSRASGPRTSSPGTGGRPMIRATRRSTSMASSGRTPRTGRSRTWTRCSTRKGAGKEAKLAFSLNVLMENRHGLCVDVSVARATGYAEREEALRMVRRQRANGIRPRPWARTRPTTRADFVARAASRGHHAARGASTSRRSAARISMAARRAIPATRSASGRASGSRRSSAGARRSAAGGRAATAGSNATASGPTSSRRPTTWSG